MREFRISDFACKGWFTICIITLDSEPLHSLGITSLGSGSPLRASDRSQSAEADLPHKCDQPEKRSSPPRLRAHKSGYPLITCEYILHTLYIFMYIDLIYNIINSSASSWQSKNRSQTAAYRDVIRNHNQMTYTTCLYNYSYGCRLCHLFR